MNRFALGAALLGAALSIPGAPARADVNIGVILSLTGPGASLGIPARNTVDLWPKEIGGHKLVVTVLDDGSDPTAATVAARKLSTEYRADVLVGPSITPTSLAAVQVAGETETPILTLAGSNAIVLPADGPRRWAFKMPPSEEVPLKMVFDQMRKAGKKTLAVVAISNAYGQTFLDVAQKMAPQAGVQIVAVERYQATDTSFVAQALKIVSSRPDAVFIAAAGTPAAMPQIELRNRGYAGMQFQTQAVANNDFLRVGGPAVNGTLMPVSPLLVAEQLPAGNRSKPVAMNYVARYEGVHGAASRSLFGGMAWDAYLVLNQSVPAALKTAQPGTPAFRKALRDAIESASDLVLTHGVYTMAPTDHNGADERSQVLVVIDNGKWKYAE